MSKKNILILCPHADDEIFTFPFIRSEIFSDFKVTALFFTETFVRKKEAKKSCFLNHWESLFAFDLGYKFIDSLIHINYKELNSLINELFDKYQIIFSPLIEGGHQDHDTIAYSVIKNSILRKSNKVYFYPTYSAFGRLGLFSVMSPNNYFSDIFKMKNMKFKHCPVKSLRHMFGVYKSQIKSWLLILIPYFFNIVFKKYAKIYTLNNNLLKNEKPIIAMLKGTPLFEIHKRCEKSTWLNYIDH